jgi:hypothetical protein
VTALLHKTHGRKTRTKMKTPKGEGWGGIIKKKKKKTKE